MKSLYQFITEKSNKYAPNTKEELINIIKELISEKRIDYIAHIDTSKITDMSHLFEDIELPRNESLWLNKWDVSKVKDMSYMFYNCILNPAVSNWDVSNVENMQSMFCGCSNLVNCDLSEWNVSNVKDMSFMFNECTKFDCDLSKWNVSKVENMQSMFGGCHKFKGKGLENWNVRNVKNIRYMFVSCYELDCDLSKWNVSNIKDKKNMEHAFNFCVKLKNRKPNWYNIY